MQLDLYNDILSQGHWLRFLSFLNETSNLFHNKSYDNWLIESKGVETVSLLKLFGSNELKLIHSLKEYFQVQFDSQPTLCWRCNKQFNEFLNDDCKKCGWIYKDISHFEKEIIEKSISRNREVNKDFIITRLQVAEYDLRLSLIDESKKELFEQHQKSFSENEEIQRVIEELEKKKEKRKKEKDLLKQQLDSLENQIEELNSKLKNSESLFLKFDPIEVRQIIHLKFMDGFLIAQLDENLVFPIDIVIGLQEFSNNNKERNFKNTICFLFLPLSGWEKSRFRNIWRLDLKKYLAHYLNGEYYVSSFSHLHKKEYPYQIKYDQIQRLTL